MLDTRRQQYLQALGVDIYWRRSLAPVVSTLAQTPEQAPEAAPEAERKSLPRAVPERLLSSDLDGLHAQIRDCRSCGDRLVRRKVIGMGRQAPWLVIGIAPGLEASRHGQLVTGPAQQLQNAMFRVLGLDSQQLCFTSLVRCPAPDNRRPSDEEQAACLHFLKAEIELLKPEVIFCFGSKVGQALLDTQAPMEELRGCLHHYGPQQIPLVVSYHPDWLLRHPEHKAGAWADLQRASKRF